MTDQTIIDLFWQRSEDAIRNTSQKYGKYLMKIAMNILKYYEESEECVNDTYFAAWEQIPPDRPQKLLPYLGCITRCLVLNRYDYLTAQKRNAEFTLPYSFQISSRGQKTAACPHGYGNFFCLCPVFGRTADGKDFHFFAKIQDFLKEIDDKCKKLCYIFIGESKRSNENAYHLVVCNCLVTVQLPMSVS